MGLGDARRVLLNAIMALGICLPAAPAAAQMQKIEAVLLKILPGPPDLAAYISAPSYLFGPGDGSVEPSVVTVTVSNLVQLQLGATEKGPGGTERVPFGLAGSDVQNVRIDFEIPPELTLQTLHGPPGLQCYGFIGSQNLYCGGAAIAAGKSAVFRLEITGKNPGCAGARARLRVAVDPSRAIGETDETNNDATGEVGSSRVDLQACKLEYSIVSPK